MSGEQKGRSDRVTLREMIEHVSYYSRMWVTIGLLFSLAAVLALGSFGLVFIFIKFLIGA
jgi:hypothetical protein